MCKQMQLCVFASPSLCVKINEGRNENMKNDCSQQLSCHCRGCCFPLLPRRHEHMLACLPEVFFTHTYIYMHTFGLPQLALVVDVLNVIIHIVVSICMYVFLYAEHYLGAWRSPIRWATTQIGDDFYVAVAAQWHRMQYIVAAYVKTFCLHWKIVFFFNYGAMFLTYVCNQI